MNEDFEKFKKKLLVEHFLKSLLFSLATGLVGAGISMIVSGFSVAGNIWVFFAFF